jgi:hypothetical protein
VDILFGELTSQHKRKRDSHCWSEAKHAPKQVVLVLHLFIGFPRLYEEEHSNDSEGDPGNLNAEYFIFEHDVSNEGHEGRPTLEEAEALAIVSEFKCVKHK